MKLSTRLLIAAFLIFLIPGGAVRGAVKPDTAAQNQVGAVAKESTSIPSYYRIAQSDKGSVGFPDVSPILTSRCVMCHKGPKAPHDLRLDDYAAVMKGAKHGPVVIPGKPAESKLVGRIRGQIKPRMPMNGPPWLTDEETKLIESWIKDGAKG